MNDPLAVELSIVTRLHDQHVAQTITLAEAEIEVRIDYDISDRHKSDLLATLGHLLPLLDRLWKEEPEDGQMYLIDLRRAVDG